jgi:hypothetical protein
MPPGPLDRWLQRRLPLEPVQPQPASYSDAPRSQQTAEPPSSSEQQDEGRKAPLGTLDSYLTRRGAKEEEKEEQEAAWTRQHPQRPFAGCARKPRDGGGS